MVQVIRDELEALARRFPADTSSIARIARVMALKPDPLAYWTSKGRRRFERELEADGVDRETSEVVLAVVDDLVQGDALDDVLRSLRSRY